MNWKLIKDAGIIFLGILVLMIIFLPEKLTFDKIVSVENIYNQFIEIKTEDNIKSIRMDLIESFNVEDNKFFINTDNINFTYKVKNNEQAMLLYNSFKKAIECECGGE